MRRGLVVGVQTAVLLLAGASPALSHATFPGQGPLAAQADQTLNMAVPEERDPDTHNVGVTVALPASWTGVHCQATAPWHCTLTPVNGSNPAQIQWTKDPPGAPPGPDDVAFVFTVHTGGPGDYPIPVIQTYSTGPPASWIGPPNADYPAPVLTVSAPAASPPRHLRPPRPPLRRRQSHPPPRHRQRRPGRRPVPVPPPPRPTPPPPPQARRPPRHPPPARRLRQRPRQPQPPAPPRRPPRPLSAHPMTTAARRSPTPAAEHLWPSGPSLSLPSLEPDGLRFAVDAPMVDP
jgi:hypothetical protein